jgi:hypothetical protein
VLLDLERPEVVLRRSDEWVMAPVTSYESVGDVDKVIFPNGWVLDETTDTLNLYYGAGDSVIGLATARFSEVMEYVRDAPLYHHRRISDDGTGPAHSVPALSLPRPERSRIPGA